MRRAIAIVLTDEQRSALGVLARSRTAAARLVTRARIVLLAADGAENQSIAASLNVAEGTVRLWRSRFAGLRLPGIARAPAAAAPRADLQAQPRQAVRAKADRRGRSVPAAVRARARVVRGREEPDSGTRRRRRGRRDSRARATRRRSRRRCRTRFGVDTGPVRIPRTRATDVGCLLRGHVARLE